MSRVGLIDTGCANLASVRFALQRLDADIVVSQTPDGLADCPRLVLPGVGAAAPAMAQLRRAGWDAVLKADTRPLLGICLGMQLLFDRSAEGDVACLGLIPGRVEKLPRPDDGVWPHMGWNTIEAIHDDEPLLKGVSLPEHVYFVHGFYVPTGDAARASTTYGTGITAMARHGHVAGCQFHPERSGKTGAAILQNFLELN